MTTVHLDLEIYVWELIQQLASKLLLEAGWVLITTWTLEAKFDSAHNVEKKNI